QRHIPSFLATEHIYIGHHLWLIGCHDPSSSISYSAPATPNGPKERSSMAPTNSSYSGSMSDQSAHSPYPSDSPLEIMIWRCSAINWSPAYTRSDHPCAVISITTFVGLLVVMAGLLFLNLTQQVAQQA